MASAHKVAALLNGCYSNYWTLTIHVTNAHMTVMYKTKFCVL